MSATTATLATDEPSVILYSREGREKRIVSSKDSEYISATAAASILRVSRITVWRYVRDGIIEPAGYTRGGQARFWRPDVIRLRDQWDREHAEKQMQRRVAAKETD